METVSSSDDPNYDNHFDSRKYLERYYGKDSQIQEMDKESIFLLTFLNNIFSSGRIKNESLIEIGAGPSIFNILSACETFEKIYLTDYFQGNLEEIKKWLNSENDAFDWSPYIKFVCDLENNGSTPNGKKEKMKRIVSFMKSDVSFSNPLHPISLPLTDCVLTSSCLTSACKTFLGFKIAIKNIASLIKPGGYLIIVDYLETSYYMVGKVKFPFLSLDENLVREAVAESGCKIEEFQTCNEFDIPEELFDSKHVFYLLAKKL